MGKVVAELLGYKDSKRAIYDHVDEEDKTTDPIQGPGSNYKSYTILISELGLCFKIKTNLLFVHY